MDISEDFEQLKIELKEKWLDYYEVNRNWLKISVAQYGQNWKTLNDGTEANFRCPNSMLIIGVLSGIDKRAADFIDISVKLSGVFEPNKILNGLGLSFDPDIALEKREKALEEKEEIQEAKLLTTGDSQDDDLGLDELRKEARQLMNNS